MSQDASPHGVRIVTWRQFQLGLFCVFIGNAVFTVLVVIAVTRQAGPKATPITNTNSVIIGQDKAELIAKLAQEKMNAGLQ